MHAIAICLSCKIRLHSRIVLKDQPEWALYSCMPKDGGVDLPGWPNVRYQKSREPIANLHFWLNPTTGEARILQPAKASFDRVTYYIQPSHPGRFFPVASRTRRLHLPHH